MKKKTKTQLISEILSGHIPYLRVNFPTTDSPKDSLNEYRTPGSLYYFDGCLTRLEKKPRGYHKDGIQLWMLVTAGGYYHTQIIFPCAASPDILYYRHWSGDASNAPYWSRINGGNRDTAFDVN